MTVATRSRSHFWIWVCWVAAVYIGWAWVVFAHPGRWETVRSHWPIAVAMTFGSFVAGSAPLGGGSVGFPILVLVFGLPTTLGRDFSLAVQSVGMVSASIFILTRGQSVAWPVLRGALVGATVGLPIGLRFLAPHLQDDWTKLVFAVVCASFGLLHLHRLREIATFSKMTARSDRWSFTAGAAVGGLASATVVATTGVGIDLFVYLLLVLLCRADLRVAVPTAVMAMAYTSVVGVVFTASTTGLAVGAVDHFLAAVPVVGIGAPIGAYVVSRVGRKRPLLMVAVLGVLQFAWIAFVERATLGLGGLVAGLGATGALLLGFEWAFERSRVRDAALRADRPQHSSG